MSPQTLELLDIAMTKLWFEQVAMGASLGGASQTIHASLLDNVRRLNELGMHRRTRTSRQPEKRMAAHKYKMGQQVIYYPPKNSLFGPSKYKILRLLPIEDGEPKYRIKSATEDFERVATETQLKT
jgi:hypothetical protein